MMKIMSWVCLSLLMFSFLYLVKESAGGGGERGRSGRWGAVSRPTE